MLNCNIHVGLILHNFLSLFHINNFVKFQTYISSHQKKTNTRTIWRTSHPQPIQPPYTTSHKFIHHDFTRINFKFSQDTSHFYSNRPRCWWNTKNAGCFCHWNVHREMQPQVGGEKVVWTRQFICARGNLNPSPQNKYCRTNKECEKLSMCIRSHDSQVMLIKSIFHSFWDKF